MSKVLNELVGNLSNEQKVRNLVIKEYNNMFKNYTGHKDITDDDLETVSIVLDREFINRHYHIDNGQYCVNSGTEDIYHVEIMKTREQYCIKKIRFTNGQNSTEIHYLT